MNELGLVGTVSGSVWHFPGPMEGRTACGAEIYRPVTPPICRKCERAEIERIRRVYGHPDMTAGEFSQFLPDYLRSSYWRLKIEEYFEREGLDPDA